MNHLPHLIQDLGLILIIAGITTLLFKKLRQPVVLGYILAGLLIGPNFPLFPSVADIENIRIWADIGVIFLLFTLGLEFSFKKLMHIGGPASITAIIEVGAMLVIGFLLGRVMGWSLMDCIFLGGIISIASTTIIIRAFDEQGLKGKRFANLVFGVLIVEDLVAVVLLVLLSTIAVSREFEGAEMLLSVAKLTFFLLLWFIAGIFFIPTFLRRVQRALNDETLLVVSIGLCLLMVILASKVGFSPALGAFIMGSILAETIHAERIEHIVKPVKDLFGAIFFVSVGMLLDPKVLGQYALPVLVITLALVIFKTLNVTLGALVSGQPLKTSIHAGMSMAQIGEFSFIIAILGRTLGVTSNFLYPVAVAVSAITAFTTPYMIKAAGPFYTWIEDRLPVRWKKTLTRYSTGAQAINTASDWQLVLRAFFIHIVTFSFIVFGTIVIFSRYVRPWLSAIIRDGSARDIIAATACLLVIAPFLWAMVTRKLQPQAFANLWSNKRFRGPLILLRIIRTGLALILISVLLLSFFSYFIALMGLLLLVILALIFSKRIHAYYIRLENRFFENFHDRERHAAVASRHELAPWDAHITQFAVPDGSPISGKSLEQMAVRENLGVNIAMIRRGENYTIPAPERWERVYPGDRLFVIGTDEQLEAFGKYIVPENKEGISQMTAYEIVLKKIVVAEGSFLIGQTIRESGIREKTNGLIVGIERAGKRTLNPGSKTVFEVGDKIWIVGDAVLIERLLLN